MGEQRARRAVHTNVVRERGSLRLVLAENWKRRGYVAVALESGVRAVAAAS